jgi:hypothetical protein
VFSDVTDSLQMVSDVETLASGNLDIDDWVAQVTPTRVRAFRLDTTSAAALDWHPPAGTSITSGAVSNGFIVLQCLSHVQHSILVLHLRDTGDTGGEVAFVQLGEPFLLADEVSCIGNVTLVSSQPHAVLTLGTYRPSILLLELRLGDVIASFSAWNVLGESSLDGTLLPLDDKKTFANLPASSCISPKAPVSTPEKRRRDEDDEREVDFGLSKVNPASEQELAWDYKWMMPSSPLAAAAKDQLGPEQFRNKSGNTVPASIVVSQGLEGLEIWVSSRSGDVHRLQIQGLALTSPTASAAAELPVEEVLSFISHRVLPHGELPPKLWLLPLLKRVSPTFKVLAVSDRVSLLRASPNCGAADELRIHSPGVSCAIPLVLEVPAGGDRLFLLSVSIDGALSLSSLEAHQRSKVIAWPLPWHPDVVASDEEELPGIAVIAGRKWYHHGATRDNVFALPTLAIVDASSGKILHDLGDQITVIAAEKITGIAIIPHDFEIDRLAIDRQNMRSGLPLGYRSNGERCDRCWILASTSIDKDNWTPGHEQGRVLLFSCPVNPGEPLQLIETHYFADPVTAVEYSVYDGNAYMPMVVVATKRRITVYILLKDRGPSTHLVKRTSICINSTATALHCSSIHDSHYASRSKLIHAACEEGEVTIRLSYSTRNNIAIYNEMPSIEVKDFSSEIFECVDVRQEDESDHISLESSGMIRVNCRNPWEGGIQGHVGTDVRPLGIVQLLEGGQSHIEKELLIVTRGGGVIELKKHDYHARERTECVKLLNKRFLLALQQAILEYPNFKFESMSSVNRFLGIDRSKAIYTHQQPLIVDEEDETGSERMATTAEGPPLTAISAEPALEEFLSTVETLIKEKLERESTVLDELVIFQEMVNLSVLKLFLECSLDTQRELYAAAVEKIDSGGDEVKDVDIDALVYELAQIGAHSMF